MMTLAEERSNSPPTPPSSDPPPTEGAGAVEEGVASETNNQSVTGSLDCANTSSLT